MNTMDRYLLKRHIEPSEESSAKRRTTWKPDSTDNKNESVDLLYDNASEEHAIEYLQLMMPKIDPTSLRWKDINDVDLNLKYIQLFPKLVADTIFNHLEQVLQFDESIQKAKIFGKWYNIPRKQVAFGDEGLTYTFSGNTVPALPWTNLLLEIRRILLEATGIDFNFVLINRYKDGNDRIGAHRDDEKDLDAGAPIASLSFGQARDFVFKHYTLMTNKPLKNAERNLPLEPTIELLLEHGSLLLMIPPTNQYWFHALPARKNIFLPRLNMTFRKILLPSKPPGSSQSSVVKSEVSSPTSTPYEFKQLPSVSFVKSAPSTPFTSNAFEFKERSLPAFVTSTKNKPIFVFGQAKTHK